MQLVLPNGFSTLSCLGSDSSLLLFDYVLHTTKEVLVLGVGNAADAIGEITVLMRVLGVLVSGCH